MKRQLFLFILSILALILVACSGSDEVLDSPQITAGNTPIETAQSSSITVVEESAGTASSNSQEYLGSYSIDDTGFGTQVTVTVDEEANTRTIESNALPNHETGEFPNAGNPSAISAQDTSWTFPIEPVYVGTASFSRTPGVTISGIKYEPDTAERATCDTGEQYSIEAIQDVTDLGLDFNNAHVQPTGEYHYHGVSDLLVDAYSTDQDLVHVAFAADGHLIYYSKSNVYSPSYRIGDTPREGENCTYSGGPLTPIDPPLVFGSVKDGSLKSDWEYDESYGELDECNGTMIDGEYAYLITDDYPYVPRCLMGSTTGSDTGGGAGGGERPEGAPADGERPEGGPPADGERPEGPPPQ